MKERKSGKHWRKVSKKHLRLVMLCAVAPQLMDAVDAAERIARRWWPFLCEHCLNHVCGIITCFLAVFAVFSVFVAEEL